MNALGRLRRARAADADTIVGWFPDRATVVLWSALDPPNPVTAAWVAALIETPSDRRYFVTADAADAPTSVFGLRVLEAEGRVHVVHVALSDGLRGRGRGGELMDAILAAARAEAPDLGRVTLNVFASNAAAIRAYERAGFAVYEQAEAAEDPSGLVLRMQRRLEAPVGSE